VVYSTTIGDSQPTAKSVAVAALPVSVVTQAEIEDVNSDVNDAQVSGKKLGAMYLMTPTTGGSPVLVCATGADADDTWVTFGTDNLVTEIGTRTTPGTWTLTDLTVGKPLIIGVDGQDKVSDFVVRFRVISGSDIGKSIQPGVVFSLGAFIDEWDDKRANPSFVLVPTATSVAIDIHVTNGAVARAYQ
jgi:hypothetical protein